MNENTGNEDQSRAKATEKSKVFLMGYASYPVTEDINLKSKNEQNEDPEDVSKLKAANENSETTSTSNFTKDKSGRDMDVPGSELDDAQEDIGDEDEENNYYSLGGDEHNNLEENDKE